MSDKFKIIDNSGDKKYFTMIPNYIINHSTVYEQAIYLYMKRIAGENGTCWSSPQTIAEVLDCSKNTVVKYQQKLVERGWIREIGERGKTKPTKEYEIVDLWDLNMEYYSKQKEKSPSDLSQEKSNGEKKSHPVTLEKSPGDTKNNNKEELKNNISSNANVADEKKVSVTGNVIEPNKNGEMPVLVKTKEGYITHNNEFTDLIKLFKPINPSIDRLYQNKGQTDALKRLLEDHGYHKIKMVIEKLPQIVGRPYAPVITTPYHLEQKLGQLFIYMKSEKNKGGGVVDARNL
jgi:hypothetical protein